MERFPPVTPFYFFTGLGQPNRYPNPTWICQKRLTMAYDYLLNV